MAPFPVEHHLQEPALIRPMWIDSHAHLSDCTDDDLAGLLSEASANDVSAVVTTAVDCTSARIVVDQCKRWTQLWGAIGISPFDVAALSPQWADHIAALAAHPKIIAIGEIGIDATNTRYPPMEQQLPVFEQQLDIARRLGLPAIIHSRGAETEAVGICRRCGVADAVFHCFTGDKTALNAILDAGYHVSLSGIITFRNNGLHELANRIPADRLLIETDTPYLAPEPHRGKKNRPAWVSLTGQKIAALLNTAPHKLAQQIETNFRRLFTNYDTTGSPAPAADAGHC